MTFSIDNGVCNNPPRIISLHKTLRRISPMKWHKTLKEEKGKKEKKNVDLIYLLYLPLMNSRKANVHTGSRMSKFLVNR